MIDERINKRIEIVKDVAIKLNAEYYFGSKSIRNDFDFELNDDFYNSNIISGNIEGYRFYFLETYHIRSGNSGRSRWVTQLILKLREDEQFPDFNLITRKAAIKDAICILIFSLMFMIIPLIIIYANKLEKSVLALIILSIFELIGLTALYYFIKETKTIFSNNNKYKIMDERFNRKYVIFSEDSSEKIGEFFSYKVCNNIVNYPSDINVTFKKNCYLSKIESDKLLTPEYCNKKLKDIVPILNLFKESSDF